jgi:hypothetical protein
LQLSIADYSRGYDSAQVYFSEEFGGTSGPIQFYITVDGQKQKVFELNERPVITTKVATGYESG